MIRRRFYDDEEDDFSVRNFIDEFDDSGAFDGLQYMIQIGRNYKDKRVQRIIKMMKATMKAVNKLY